MRRSCLVAAVISLAACGSSGSPSPRPEPTTVAAPAAPASPSRVVDATFTSAALGATKAYRVWLPAGYDDAPTRRYPVVYMLHGLGGSERDWIDGGQLDQVAAGLRLDAIVVMPDGDSGFYANWAAQPDRATCMARGNPFAPKEDHATYCVEHANYEDYIVRDLIAHVDATYRTLARREARGIGGLSMGGFGALQLALRHQDLFAATASHSGVDALLYVGPHPYQAGKVVTLTDVATWGKDMEPFGGYMRGIFGPDLANWQQHDPVALAAALKPGALEVYLDCGTEDVFSLEDHAQYLHDVLTATGVAHDWYLGPGRHDFSFWGERIDDSLGFFARALAKPEA